MVIGNGLISRAFDDYFGSEYYLIFASGVSDSNENRDSEYQREFDLIKSNLSNKSKFIYFSTINTGDRKYFLHKRNMEKYIIENSNNYLIFRLPNIVGHGGNQNNLFNYLNKKIMNEEIIKVQNVYRSLVDVHDMKNICKYCFFLKNKILEISGIETIKVSEIVEVMSYELNKKPEVELIEGKLEQITKNSSEVEEALNFLRIERKDYTKKLIKKNIKK